MFESLGNALQSARQKALEAAIRSLVNQRIEKYGQIIQLEIHPVQKRARLEIALKGEPAPLEVHIDAYELQSAEARLLLSIRKIRASREWITAALEDFVVGRQFPVPEAARLAL
jgi:hypothetical protein